MRTAREHTLAFGTDPVRSPGQQTHIWFRFCGDRVDRGSFLLYAIFFSVRSIFAAFRMLCHRRRRRCRPCSETSRVRLFVGVGIWDLFYKKPCVLFRRPLEWVDAGWKTTNIRNFNAQYDETNSFLLLLAAKDDLLSPTASRLE